MIKTPDQYDITRFPSPASSMILEQAPGTYALIPKSVSKTCVQIGRWREIKLQPGFYIYVGSALGPGGVRARVSRHLRSDKSPHWHIDYLRRVASLVEVWVSYDSKRLEHQWAKILLNTLGMTSIQGFGCSDCKCSSHLFYTAKLPKTCGIDNFEILPL